MPFMLILSLHFVGGRESQDIREPLILLKLPRKKCSAHRAGNLRRHATDSSIRKLFLSILATFGVISLPLDAAMG